MVRAHLSHYPLAYAIVAGIGIVSFWRGVWGTSDILNIAPPISLFIGLIVLLATGVLVTEFLGNRIIISGLSGEKKIEEKTIQEVRDEEMFLVNLKNKVDKIEKMVEDISDKEDSN